MRRSGLFPFRTARLALACAVALSLPACKKKDGDTENPGGGGASADAIAKQIEAAKAEAKVAGLVDLANKDLVAGRYVSATKRAEEALADDENNADAYAIIGAARWRAADFQGSTEAYEKALEIDPKNYGAALGVARNYQAVGRDKDAVAVLDTVLKDDDKQLEPHIAKLWSTYTMLDADAAAKEADAIFLAGIAEDDPIIPLIQAYSAYMRPLAGKGPFIQVSGTGSTSLGIDPGSGVKFAGGVVGDGGFTQVVLTEIFEENIIDAEFAKSLGLKAVGKFKPLGTSAETDIVIIPEIKFGDFVMKKVPAYVQSLEHYEGMVGETPGIQLGRHALIRIGAMKFDYPAFQVELSADPPSPPDGAIEVPLLMVSWHVRHAPVVPIKLGGSEHSFYAYFGGLYVSGLAISKKHYLKSGFLPRHVDPPDDAERGLKMVYVDGWELGGEKMDGVGGLVLVNEPPDPTIREFLENAAFEIGGLINVNQLKGWKVTMSLSASKIIIER